MRSQSRRGIRRRRLRRPWCSARYGQWPTDRTRAAPASSCRPARSVPGPPRTHSLRSASSLRRAGCGVRTALGFYRISVKKPRGESRKCARGARVANRSQEPEIERQVVEREETVGEELKGHEEVAEIGARE